MTAVNIFFLDCIFSCEYFNKTILLQHILISRITHIFSVVCVYSWAKGRPKNHTLEIKTCLDVVGRTRMFFDKFIFSSAIKYLVECANMHLHQHQIDVPVSVIIFQGIFFHNFYRLASPAHISHNMLAKKYINHWTNAHKYPYLYKIQ